ncbi:AAA family ATPase [Companilactobacillus halodurans]|uniref:ATP-binding protein n=1 Tax=Companilactobacillus halodurans TaxID=2584183 RepID=A0A5P0ZQA4_9LACO|nr:AAA family ATPase [Companilactobacillus halodurans]MQS76299.1 ATP-binding protein [Companilactobacillus halodurans]MQS96570.1 ATP-binding protein [Companilactobacillus halodurans]
MTNKLRFLAINIKGYPLFEDNLHFSLLTNSRVSKNHTESLMHLFGANYTNNVTTIVGKNATGKTTIMKLTMGILSLLSIGRSIKETKLKEALFDDSTVTFDVYFYGSNNFLYQDTIVIGKSSDEVDSDLNEYEVKSEKIYRKKARISEAKKNLLKFSKNDLIMDRNNLNTDVAAVLASDDSMFRTVMRSNNYETLKVADNTIFTNTNFFISNFGSVPSEVLQYLDSSIEYLKIESANNNNTNQQIFYRLKFKNSNQEITDRNFATIEYYLSSGTAKGISLYTQILSTLKNGGIIFVDEIENHFNHAIARTFINYFKDPAININNAKLVFTTHYSEFLDDIDRNDQIFIARRLKNISLTRYSNTKIRNDLLRSEVFMSNSIQGTAPEYSAYIALKKTTIKSIKEFNQQREEQK